MITITNLAQRDLFINLSGTVSHDDYSHVLTPVLTNLFKQYEQVNLCIQFSSDFHDMEFKALVDEAQLGLKYWPQWHKVALLNEPQWLRPIAVAIEAIAPVTIDYFSTELEAELWFQEEDYF